MTSDELEARIGAVSRLLEATHSVWPLLFHELEIRERDLVESLIAADNEQIRGRLKALRDFKELPEQLKAELLGLTEGLAD